MIKVLLNLAYAGYQNYSTSVRHIIFYVISVVKIKIIQYALPKPNFDIKITNFVNEDNSLRKFPHNYYLANADNDNIVSDYDIAKGTSVFHVSISVSAFQVVSHCNGTARESRNMNSRVSRHASQDKMFGFKRYIRKFQCTWRSSYYQLNNEVKNRLTPTCLDTLAGTIMCKA